MPKVEIPRFSWESPAKDDLPTDDQRQTEERIFEEVLRDRYTRFHFDDPGGDEHIIELSASAEVNLRSIFASRVDDSFGPFLERSLPLGRFIGETHALELHVNLIAVRTGDGTALTWRGPFAERLTAALLGDGATPDFIRSVLETSPAIK